MDVTAEGIRRQLRLIALCLGALVGLEMLSLGHRIVSTLMLYTMI